MPQHAGSRAPKMSKMDFSIPDSTVGGRWAKMGQLGSGCTYKIHEKLFNLFIVAFEDDRVEICDDQRVGQIIIVDIHTVRAAQVAVDELQLLEIGMHVRQAVGRVDDDVGFHG
jgi:hypothetical protein